MLNFPLPWPSSWNHMCNPKKPEPKNENKFTRRARKKKEEMFYYLIMVLIKPEKNKNSRLRLSQETKSAFVVVLTQDFRACVYPMNLNATRLFYLQQNPARRGKGKKGRNPLPHIGNPEMNPGYG